jgi:hypothetical protein
MARTIRSYNHCRRPDTGIGPRYAPMDFNTRKAKPDVEGREKIVALKAKELGMKLTVSAGGKYRFARENGMEVEVYGLVAAREFVRGAEFILATCPLTYKAQGWIDPEEPWNK